MNSIVKLMLDTHNEVIPSKYANTTKAEREEAIRKAIFEVLGVEEYGTKEYRNAMRKRKVEVFEIIEEFVDGVIANGERVKNAFYDTFVDTRVISLGDKNVFYSEGVNQLAISKFSGNHWNVARKRIDLGSEFSVDTFDYGIAVFEYLDRFLAGRADLAKLVTLLEEAVDRGISEACYSVFTDALANIPSNFVFNGTYSEEGIVKVLGHVEAYNNQVPVLVGTRASLAKLQGKVTVQSDNMIDEKNKNGILEYWNGYRCICLPNVHKTGTFEMAFDDSKILALPADDKLVKLVLEGESQVKEEENNADKSRTYVLTFKMGIACAYAGMIGTITLT